MFFLRYTVVPARTHPERGWLGEGLVNCWIDRRTLAAADRAARKDIREQKWDIRARETAEEVTAADYVENDEARAYYEQALTDKEVFLYHISPRYPVYAVLAAVERKAPRETADALYLIAGEALLRKREESVAVPGFWDPARCTRAVAAARKAIRAAGWTVVSVREQWPCGRDNLVEDMRFYYDEAEDDGACLVFVHEGEPDADEPSEPKSRKR
jgi:hypothetical protein